MASAYDTSDSDKTDIQLCRHHHILQLATCATSRFFAMSTTATQTVTADNVLHLFPDVNPSLAYSQRAPTSDGDLEGYDEEQIRLMEEVCIVLDNDDNPIGTASKKVCTPSRAHFPAVLLWLR